MAISSSALLPRVGSLKINIRWKPASGALENLKVAGTHSATHFTPVCSLLPMLLNSQVLYFSPWLYKEPTLSFLFALFYSLFSFLSARTKRRSGKTADEAPTLPKRTVYSFVMSPQTVSNLLACRRSRWPCSLQDRFSAGHAFCSISGELSVRSAWLCHQCC